MSEPSQSEECVHIGMEGRLHFGALSWCVLMGGQPGIGWNLSKVSGGSAQESSPVQKRGNPRTMKSTA